MDRKHRVIVEESDDSLLARMDGIKKMSFAEREVVLEMKDFVRLIDLADRGLYEDDIYGYHKD